MQDSDVLPGVCRVKPYGGGCSGWWVGLQLSEALGPGMRGGVIGKGWGGMGGI